MMGKERNSDAPNILHLIKEGTIGAEIGVWMANTSAEFQKKNLTKLYLVDPYSVEPFKNNSEMPYNVWLKKYRKLLNIAPKGLSNVDMEKEFVLYYENVYQKVKEKFVTNPEVQLVRQTSSEWFNTCPDNHLDWIYVDGEHSYEGCYADLVQAHKKVKAGGLILGDDFKWPKATWSKPGVTKAVNQFVDENNLRGNFHRHGMTQFEIRVN